VRNCAFNRPIEGGSASTGLTSADDSVNKMDQQNDRNRVLEGTKKMTLDSDKDHQARHAAICCWPLFMWRTIDRSSLREDLNHRGYDGCMGSIDAESIIHYWQQAGWIEFAPDGIQIRITSQGREQFETWKEEDRLWGTGDTNEMPQAKRLVAREPARNLRKISAVIGSSTVTGIHDPYTRTDSLKNILSLSDGGTMFSPSLRLLSAPGLKPTESISLVNFLNQINVERSSDWEIRVYSTSSRPHRGFLVCDDGSVITCGTSLNKIDKDEILDRLPAGSELAEHDGQFFEENWVTGTSL
jgi:hypothetical protein